ncbi:hypothetical protein ACVSUB_21510 [Yersinia enterocolitica]
MGSIKRYMEELEAEEAMNDWIRDYVDLGVEEGDPEWEDLKSKILSGEVIMETIDYWDDRDYEDQIQWFTKEERAFPLFNEQIHNIRTTLNNDTSPLVLKMKFSYIVTLMESCLGDMLKGFIFSDNKYIINALNGVKELKEIKVPLIEVHQNSDLINKSILKVLSEYLYHNVEKIVPIYRSVVGETLPDNIKKELGKIIKIVNMRHDIVHRNGYDIEGTEIELTSEIYNTAIQDIVDFVTAMNMYIESAKAKHVFSQVELTT